MDDDEELVASAGGAAAARALVDDDGDEEDKEMANEEDDLDRRVAQIKANVISQKSKRVYLSKMIDFIMYLDQDDRDRQVLSGEFMMDARRDDGGKLLRSALKEHMSTGSKRACPV